MRTTIGSLEPVEHLVDPLVQVGLHVAVQAGVAVDHLLDRGQRLVVVGLRVDADPVLGEVDADDLVGQHAWPMCEPKLRTPGMARSSLLAAVDDPLLLRSDVPGLVIQCIRKSRSLNVGQQRLAQQRQRRATPASDRRRRPRA